MQTTLKEKEEEEKFKVIFFLKLFLPFLALGMGVISLSLSRFFHTNKSKLPNFNDF